MAKSTYQTYTEDTPISVYRQDFIRRAAMCAALAKRYTTLGGVATEAEDIVVQIDGKLAGLQKAEDNQTRARAIEDVEKLEVADVYTEARRTMFAKHDDVTTILPDAPSALRRLGAESFAKRAEIAVANLKALPDTDSIRVAFLPSLEKELADFHAADKAEDATRAALQSGRTALTLYKSELSQVREAQLGSIQAVFRDRGKTAMLTIPWRKTTSNGGDEPTDTSEAEAPPQNG